MLQQTHGPEIDRLLTRYAQRRSAVLPLLFLAQDTYGHLDDHAIREVAQVLNVPETDVFEVVGFYTLFHDRPVGTWVVQVCDDVPCCFLGAEELVDALKQSLGIREEQVTPDGAFLLQRVKCLAACDKAPVVQANLDYYYKVTPDAANALLDNLRARANEAQRSVSGRFAEDWTLVGGHFEQTQRPRNEATAQPTDSLGMTGAALPSEPEAAKATEEAAESAPAEPAVAAAEAKMERESPVEPSLDRSPAGQHRDPDKGDQGAIPARPQQQEPPREAR